MKLLSIIMMTWFMVCAIMVVISKLKEDTNGLIFWGVNSILTAMSVYKIIGVN